MKRSRSSIATADDEVQSREKRSCPQTDLLTSLTEVLSEIRSTPSTGEISAELMETFKVLLLQIEEFSSDESNLEGRLVKDESERCLETWLDDLVAQCQADGVLFIDEEDVEHGDDDDDGDLSEEDELALALVLQQDQDGIDLHRHHHDAPHIQNLQGDDDEDDDEEIIVVDDDDTLDAHQIQVMA